MASNPVDPHFWRVEDVHLDSACDFVLALHHVLDLKPAILAASNWRKHGARHSDATKAIVAQFDVHLIIKRHIFITDRLPPC